MTQIKTDEQMRLRVTAFQYRVDGASIRRIAETMRLDRRRVSQLVAAEGQRIANERAGRREQDLTMALYRRDEIILRCRAQMNADRKRLDETGPHAPSWQERASLREAIAKWERQIEMTLSQIDELLGLKVKPKDEPPVAPPSLQNNILLVLNSLPPEEVIAIANEAAAGGRGSAGFGKIEDMARALTTAQENAREPLPVDQEPFE
jgi:predicted XRE-type DNA-binding protein